MKLLRPRRSNGPPLFDWKLFFEWVGFVWRSLGRHPALGAAVFGLTLSVAIAAAVFLPRRYLASTRLLARPTGFMASLTNPNGWYWDDAPTRAARERVLARDSLQKIAQDTDLVAQWQARRGTLPKMKDQLMQLIDGAWNADVWSDIVVGTLEKKLQVTADDETVEIAVEWPDAEMARRIVETASRNFLETRHVSELAAITETIGILELHASQTEGTIEEALLNLRRVVAERSQNDRRVLARAAANVRGRPRHATSQELAQVKFMLRGKQRALADLVEQRSRTLNDLKARLAQQRVVSDPTNPAITELERAIASLKRDTPQMAQLRRDVIDLERELEEKGGKPDESARARTQPAQGTGLVSEASLANLPPELERDPSISVAQDQVRVALGRHQELLQRVQMARISLDTVRAAFKYRFHAVKPPQTPRTALAPNVPLLLLAGIFLGVVLAFFATAGLDVWRRTLCEPWQVRRLLNLPLLVELKGPPR